MGSVKTTKKKDTQHASRKCKAATTSLISRVAEGEVKKKRDAHDINIYQDPSSCCQLTHTAAGHHIHYFLECTDSFANKKREWIAFSDMQEQVENNHLIN